MGAHSLGGGGGGMAAAACGQEVIVQVWPHAGSQTAVGGGLADR